MVDKRMSDFAAVGQYQEAWLAGFDLSRPLGQQNIRVAIPALLAAAGSGTVPTVSTVFDMDIPTAFETRDFQLVDPVAADTDLTVFNVTIQSPTIAAARYNLLLYAGNPILGGKLIFDYEAKYTQAIGEDGNWTFELADGPLYLPASGFSNQLWCRIISRDTNPITLSARAITIEYLGLGEQLPVWVDPPPYTGPLMDEVYVGPSRQFIEPRFGLQALADGGTMYIDPGTYYYPFGVSWDPIIANDLRFGYNPNHPLGAARFINGITIKGSGCYNDTPTIFHGRGGYGLIPTHPFRMIRQQGFIWANSPITVEDIRFMWCGGYDQDSDGEAAVYLLNFQNPGDTVTLRRCGFDANENGIFTQYWHGDSPGETDPSNATGNSRYLTLNIENCDFGYMYPNGAAGDGGSHDFYVNSMWLNVSDSNFYGDLGDWRNFSLAPPMRAANTAPSFYAGGNIVNPPTSGNCAKSRSRYVTFDNCYFRANSGKWIDRPDGGQTTVNNCRFLTIESSTNLCLAYNTEQAYAIPLSDQIYTDCTIYLQRVGGFGHIWWMLAPGHKFDFSQAGNHLVWANPSAGLVINRTNSQFGVDLTAFSGFTGEYEFLDGLQNSMRKPAGMEVGALPPTPPPASLRSGETAAVPPGVP